MAPSLLRRSSPWRGRALRKPFVKSNKNDFVDAEAIVEAVERKNMRFVPIKTDDQLELQAIHRVRDRLNARRTAVINQLRAFLLERGMVFAKTPANVRMAMPEVLENAENDTVSFAIKSRQVNPELSRGPNPVSGLRDKMTRT
jgi:Transposase